MLCVFVRKIGLKITMQDVSLQKPATDCNDVSLHITIEIFLQ